MIVVIFFSDTSVLAQSSVYDNIQLHNTIQYQNNCIKMYSESHENTHKYNSVFE